MENKNMNQQSQKNFNTDVEKQGSKSAPSTDRKESDTGRGSTYGATTGSEGTLRDADRNAGKRRDSDV